MTANEAFDKYFSSLNNVERIAKFRDLRASLGVSRSCIYNWRHGRCKIAPSLRDKITAVIGRDIFKNVTI